MDINIALLICSMVMVSGTLNEFSLSKFGGIFNENVLLR